MIYIVMALKCEAKPLVKHYGLEKKSDKTLPYYRNENVVLVLTGPGVHNATINGAIFLGMFTPQQHDIFINFGVCAAPDTLAIGTVLLANKICRNGGCFYPDILYRHSLVETTVSTADSPADSPADTCVDMEAHTLYSVASRFFNAHNMAFIKVVSDHFKPDSVTSNVVENLCTKALEPLCATLETMACIQKRKAPLFSEGEEAVFGTLEPLFTHSQMRALKEACSYYKLKHKTSFLSHLNRLTHTANKQERKHLHAQLLNTLTD